VDEAFPALARDYRGWIAWLDRDEARKLGAALADGTPDGLTFLSKGERETAPRAAARGAS
jgi:hypothetical protein